MIEWIWRENCATRVLFWLNKTIKNEYIQIYSFFYYLRYLVGFRFIRDTVFMGEKVW